MAISLAKSGSKNDAPKAGALQINVSLSGGLRLAVERQMREKDLTAQAIIRHALRLYLQEQNGTGDDLEGGLAEMEQRLSRTMVQLVDQVGMGQETTAQMADALMLMSVRLEAFVEQFFLHIPRVSDPVQRRAALAELPERLGLFMDNVKRLLEDGPVAIGHATIGHSTDGPKARR